jgi:hypothetical protein
MRGTSRGNETNGVVETERKRKRKCVDMEGDTIMKEGKDEI